MNKGYMADMKIVDQRLTACEEKMKKLAEAVRRIIELLELYFTKEEKLK